jgi:hypothetical protein
MTVRMRIQKNYNTNREKKQSFLQKNKSGTTAYKWVKRCFPAFFGDFATELQKM